MIFIVGTKNSSKSFGSARKMTCGHCNNSVDWQLIKKTTWISFFFIPIIPLSNQYYEMCPVCRGLIERMKDDFYDLVEKATLKTL